MQMAWETVQLATRTSLPHLSLSHSPLFPSLSVCQSVCLALLDALAICFHMLIGKVVLIENL